MLGSYVLVLGSLTFVGLCMTLPHINVGNRAKYDGHEVMLDNMQFVPTEYLPSE